MKAKRIAINYISHYNQSARLELTRTLLQEKGFEVDPVIQNSTWWAWQNRMSFFEKYEKVIVALGNSYLQPIGASLLKNEEALGILTINIIPAHKVIAVSYSNPYYVNFYNFEAPIHINAYNMDNFTQQAVVNALTGVKSFVGTTSVGFNHAVML